MELTLIHGGLGLMLAGVLRELAGLGVKDRGHGIEQKLGLWSVEIKPHDPEQFFVIFLPDIWV